MLKPILIQNVTAPVPLEVGLWLAPVAIISIGAWLYRSRELADEETLGPLLRRVNELPRHGKAEHVQARTAVRARTCRIAATRRDLRAEKEFFQR
jgi:hypothetical protein